MPYSIPDKWVILLESPMEEDVKIGIELVKSICGADRINNPLWKMCAGNQVKFKHRSAKRLIGVAHDELYPPQKFGKKYAP